MNPFIDLIAEDLDFIDATVRELRDRLGLEELSPKERRRIQGQWFKTGESMGERAARVWTVCARFMQNLPYDGEGIQRQVARVNLAGYAHTQLQHSADRARDTLLRERARLFAMIMGVLKTLQACERLPGLDPGTRGFLNGNIKMLRPELDRRNANISKGMKKNQAKLPPAQAPFAALPKSSAAGLIE